MRWVNNVRNKFKVPIHFAIGFINFIFTNMLCPAALQIHHLQIIQISRLHDMDLHASLQKKMYFIIYIPSFSICRISFARWKFISSNSCCKTVCGRNTVEFDKAIFDLPIFNLNLLMAWQIYCLTKRTIHFAKIWCLLHLWVDCCIQNVQHCNNYYIN